MKASTPDRIDVGTTYFVRTSALLTDSLFNKGGTASGTFKIRKNGILFCKPNGDPFAFLVINKFGERFFVTCSKQPDGRIRYMFGLCELDKAALGLASLGFTAERNEAERVADSLNKVN